ncbi:RidA family protein [Methylobacterium sp. P1-11]|uniref:RidA family protein n=1 Tax=Methylobacterium sp. P1-11 TaxID=2024616 RepID=UPI0011ED8E8F|nr:RidA family protein [Methylobacterium sp. P1-11]KAA0125487.1 RidA family protein [Methylobacterium sp. P1-11]
MIQRHIRTPIMHRVVEHGGVLYFGGIVAEDRSASMRGQTEQILARIDALLAETGSDKTKILTATLYITDMALKDEMNAAWTAWFAPEILPSRSTIGVAELGPQILIEAVITAAR